MEKRGDEKSAELDSEEGAKQKLPREEWKVASYWDITGPHGGSVFYVRSEQEKIYYDESGGMIAWTDEYRTLPQIYAGEKKAQEFADKINRDPELAAELAQYTFEVDVLKKAHPTPVCKKRKALKVVWDLFKDEQAKGNGSIDRYYPSDSANQFRRSSVCFRILSRKEEGKFVYDIYIYHDDGDDRHSIFWADGVDDERANSVIDYARKTCDALTLAKARTMKDADKIVLEELAKLGLG